VRLSEHPLLKPYVGKPAILDSNLVLLDWCIRFDPLLAGSFKRLSSFEGDDFNLLRETLKLFPLLRTTPHVLTEVSNLANSLPGWRKEGWSEHFARQIEIVSEEWIPASTVTDSPYLRLGLTDAALAVLASTHVILTIDFPLGGSLQSQGLNAINFASLRNSLLV
jgi:hypothetical protein